MKLKVFEGKENQELKDQQISKALEKRAISKDRNDFDNYLKSFMISTDLKDQLDTLALLINTGRGKNFGDGFTFFPNIENSETPLKVTFEIAGHRHSKGMNAFNDKTALKDKKVILKAQNDNKHDDYAVEIFLDDISIGFVPKGLNKGIYQLSKDKKIDAFIAKINGTIERPNLTVFVSID